MHDFDHHCVWLNTCVGSKNYKPFFIALCSVFGLMLTVAASCVWALVASSGDGVDAALLLLRVRAHCGTDGLSLAGLRAALCVPAALALLVAWQVASLLKLHFYLWRRGISTYDLIVERRHAEERRRAAASGETEPEMEDPGHELELSHTRTGHGHGNQGETGDAEQHHSGSVQMASMSNKPAHGHSHGHSRPASAYGFIGSGSGNGNGGVNASGSYVTPGGPGFIITAGGPDGDTQH